MNTDTNEYTPTDNEAKDLYEWVSSLEPDEEHEEGSPGNGEGEAPADGEGGTETAASETHPTEEASYDTGEVDNDDVIVVDPPKQREDGKWTQGKYVADTLEDLVVKVETARIHAEKLVGKTSAERQKAEADNPFLAPEDDGEYDEWDLDEDDFASQVSVGVAQALQQMGITPQGGFDHNAARIQTVNLARAAVNDPQASSEDFAAIVDGIIQYAPQDVGDLQAVLHAWGEIDPYSAANKTQELRFAAHQWAQEQQYSAAQQAYEAEYAQVQQAQTALAQAQTAFAERNPDWQQHDAVASQFLQRNPRLMQSAVGDPAAIYEALATAYDYARSVGNPGGAGISNGVNQGVGVDPAAAQAAAHAELREAGGLETGGDIDLSSIRSNNPTPAGVAAATTKQLFGIETA